MIQLQNYISNCLKYYYVSDAERNKMDHKYKPKKLFSKGYYHSVWSENGRELTDKEQSVMPPLEADEKKAKGLKILTPKQNIN